MAASLKNYSLERDGDTALVQPFAGDSYCLWHCLYLDTHWTRTRRLPDCGTDWLTENTLEERMIDVSPPTDLNRLLISFRGRDVLTKFRLPPPLPLRSFARTQRQARVIHEPILWLCERVAREGQHLPAPIAIGPSLLLGSSYGGRRGGVSQLPLRQQPFAVHQHRDTHRRAASRSVSPAALWFISFCFCCTTTSFSSGQQKAVPFKWPNNCCDCSSSATPECE